MPGLPWFKVASDFPSHPKTLRLCALLDDSNAGMYVVRLLAYCATYAPDGRVPLDMMKQAAGWTKQRSRLQFLVNSLETAGFIVCTSTHAEIHGWDEWNGAHVRKAAKDNARPRSDYRVPRAGTSRGGGGNLAGPALESREEKREKKQLPPDALRAPDVDLDAIAELAVPLPSLSAPITLFPVAPADDGAPASANGAAETRRPGRRSAAPKPDAAALEALTAELIAAYREVKGEELDWPRSAHGDLAAIRNALADDAEVSRRWRLFLVDAYWPQKNVNRFRAAFQHAKFQRPASKPDAPKFPAIPVFR